MKVNTTHALTSGSVLLVPYTPHHVPTYHTWMLSPSLREATASEPLTLDQEYSMQKSWRQDKDKLTFIICQPLRSGSARVRARVDDAPDRMVGDVNLFLFPSEDDEAVGSVIGELELMIAPPSHRRKGYGRSALVLFISYICSRWPEIRAEYHAGGVENPDQQKTVDSCGGKTETMSGLQYLRVKIQEGNLGSIKLFEGLGFTTLGSGANYFGEVELRLEARGVARLSVGDMKVMGYDDRMAPSEDGR